MEIQQYHNDRVHTTDNLAICSKIGKEDHIHGNASWQIHRFIDQMFEQHAKPYFEEEAEYLIMAARALNAGNHDTWFRYNQTAAALRMLGQRYANNISEFHHNLALNEGINLLTSLLCGGSGTPFNNANAYIGVGDSSAVESASQVGLQAATNKLYVAMDGSYPTFGTSQLAIWRSTFGSTQANFAWNEFTVANGNSGSAVNLNRKVSAQGTKISGQTWQCTITITWS